MNWNSHYAISILPGLLAGVWETVIVTAFAAAIALGGGLALAVLGQVGGRFARVAVRTMVDLCRGVPILVALYFGFYALPQAGVLLSGFQVGVLVLGVIYAAYCSEVYRGGLISISGDIGDACFALGLPARTTWGKVLIPLTVRRSLPALLNYVIVLLKQSAFLFAIGVPVLLARAQLDGYESFRYVEPYTLAGGLYIALNVPLVILLRLYERRKLRQGVV